MAVEVKFEEEESYRVQVPKKRTSVTSLLMRYSGGLIKDKRQAGYVLVSLIVLAGVVSIILISGNNPNIPEAALVNPEFGLPQSD